MIAHTSWQDANQAALCRELEHIHEALIRLSESTTAEDCAVDGETSPALDHVARVFGLTAFERQVLLLCAGVELESRFSQACATAQNDVRRSEEHTSELQSPCNLVCRLLLEKK